jgi:hypothetical protein
MIRPASPTAEGADAMTGKTHLVILAVALAVTLIFCLPHALFYSAHGRLPLNDRSNNPEAIPVGCTPDEVLSRLGPPHYTWDNRGNEGWVYYADVCGMWAWTVWFDTEGRVMSVTLSG